MSSKKESLFKLALRHLILLLFVVISIGPFLWLLSTAFKSAGENIFAFPPQLLPSSPTFENFYIVFEKIPMLLYIFNSFVVSIFTVLMNVFLSALAAYPLAKMDFKGNKLVFILILSTMMIPFQVIMIPTYLIILSLNLVDTHSDLAGYAGLILPFSVNAFGIFLMRQSFLSIPQDLINSALMDGCSHLKIWWNIMLPLSIPSLLTLAIFTFVGSWGEFLWPTIVLSKQTMYTLPLGLNHLQGFFSMNWRYIAAGSIISIIPILIFFLAMQKYFLKNTLQGSIK